MNRFLMKKRGAKHEAPDYSSGGWEIVYTGFILILLCFFIMLCSIATMEGTKVTSFVASFNDAVNILGGGIKTETGKFYIGTSGEMVDILKNKEMAKLYEDIASLTKELGLEPGVAVSVSKKGLVMRLPDTSFFDLGAAWLSPESMALLSKLGAVIRKADCPVQIEGHTDNIPINTGRFPSNWELSTTRAVNVLRYFTEKEKISPKRLSAAGFGEFQPVFQNDTDDGRAKNRRVEIIFIMPEDKRSVRR